MTRKQDTRILRFVVAPEQGAALMVAACAPGGYVLERMDRAGTRVVAVYRRARPRAALKPERKP